MHDPPPPPPSIRRLVALGALLLLLVFPLVRHQAPTTPIADLITSFEYRDSGDDAPRPGNNATIEEEEEDAPDKESEAEAAEEEEAVPDWLQQQLTAYRTHLAADPSSSSSSSKIDPAPRTHAGEYNEILPPSAKYFVYSPSGGMGNQIIELIYACVMVRSMNRTLLVPQLGSHSSLWYAYERLPRAGLMPMDRVLDFAHLSKYCQVVPLNVSVVQLTTQFRPQSAMHTIAHLRSRPNWNLNDLMNAVKPHRNSAQLVYFHGYGMYSHGWMSAKTFGQALRYVRFSPFLRLRAMEIVRQAFPPAGEFNAVHIRLGDYSRRWPASGSTKARYIKAHVDKHALKQRSLPLYLATDEPENPSFGLLKSAYKVTTIGKLPRKLVTDYGRLFAQDFRMDMQGVLDQLVCSQASSFIPTSWSTFSLGITQIRAHRKELFPELLVASSSSSSVKKKSSSSSSNNGGK